MTSRVMVPTPPRETVHGPGGERVRTIDSAALLGTARELRIRHQGESYTLRITRLGKLILTK
jgi:hemin uptake protein HemP